MVQPLFVHALLIIVIHYLLIGLLRAWLFSVQSVLYAAVSLIARLLSYTLLTYLHLHQCCPAHCQHAVYGLILSGPPERSIFAICVKMKSNQNHWPTYVEITDVLTCKSLAYLHINHWPNYI